MCAQLHIKQYIYIYVKLDPAHFLPAFFLSPTKRMKMTELFYILLTLNKPNENL